MTPAVSAKLPPATACCHTRTATAVVVVAAMVHTVTSVDGNDILAIVVPDPVVKPVAPKPEDEEVVSAAT